MTLLAAGVSDQGSSVIFWVFAIISIAGALGLIFSKKPVHSALSIALTMLALAVLYILQGALFVGIVQIVVYTGAIMMLFLFVLMIIGVDSTESLKEVIKGHKVIAFVISAALGVFLISFVLDATFFNSMTLDEANSKYGGNVTGIAALIFERYVVIFELSSVLLLTAALAAMVLAHRERIFQRKDQRMMVTRRVKSKSLNQLPPPGVFARGNSVNMPALDPDGKIINDSIMPSIKSRVESEDVDNKKLKSSESDDEK